MESGSFKGIEFIVIVGVVVWFYFRQMGNLKRLKEERETKQAADASSKTEPPAKS